MEAPGSHLDNTESFTNTKDSARLLQTIVLGVKLGRFCFARAHRRTLLSTSLILITYDLRF